MKRVFFLFFFFPLFVKAQINADGVISMGRNALFYEDYVLSILYFNQVIEAKPYLYEPFYYRAIAKYYLGDYMGAVSDCSESIERDPFIDNSFRLRAISQVMIGDFEKAAHDYRLLIERKNKEQETWYNLVLCESQLQRFSEADKLLDTMIVMWPKNARCYMLKAQISLEQKDTLKAEQLIDQALKIDSFDVDALAGKAMLSMKQNNYAVAEHYYERAIIQTPKRANYFLGRALARYQQKKLRGAMDDYNVALDLEPDNYAGHYNRGLLRMQVGELNLAIEDFNFVLNKEPHDRLALYNRAILLEKTGNFRGAINDYSTVLKEYPNFLIGYENRARCRRIIGDNANALKDERKVVVAQLDEMFGTRKPKHTTRKQKEQNIDEYKSLVVADESDNVANFYTNDYRGRVQNKEVDIQPQPFFVLTFNLQPDALIRHKEYANFVDKLNDQKLFNRKVYLASYEGTASEEDLKELETERVRIQKNLEKNHSDVKQLFALGMIAWSKRDYAMALSYLDNALRNDSAYLAVLFLRVAVRSHQIETKDLQNKAETSISPLSATVQISYQPLITDLTSAIRLDNQCAYLYYNRGCVYHKIQNITDAMTDYNRAIELKPDFAEAYYNRALLHVANGEYDKCFIDFGKAGELGLYSAYSLMKHFRKEQQKLAKLSVR